MTDDPIQEVEAIVERARVAQAAFERNGSQRAYDLAAQAAAWAIMEPARNRHLAELAVETTGLGNVPDKITKNHRKTLGLMRDIKGARTYGIISDDPASGITEIARPIGVIGAVVPSTNPGATPANNIINALKCGNAIVVSPSPKGVPTCEALIGYIYEEFDKLGIDRDLVQMIPGRGSKEKTQRLLEITDLIVVTGSQNNVRRAYTSGTPALAVGAGNVAVIVDETCCLNRKFCKVTVACRFHDRPCSSLRRQIIGALRSIKFECGLSHARALNNGFDLLNGIVDHHGILANGNGVVQRPATGRCWVSLQPCKQLFERFLTRGPHGQHFVTCHDVHWRPACLHAALHAAIFKHCRHDSS